MARRTPRLDVVAPCPVRWEDMSGNDRVRFCGQCEQHVYEVAHLPMDQVMALVAKYEGRLCVQLQRRSDGTVITGDCVSAIRRARERLVATAAGVAVAATGFWGSMRMLQRMLMPPDWPAEEKLPPPEKREEPPPLLWGHDEQGGRMLPDGMEEKEHHHTPKQKPEYRTRGRIRVDPFKVP